jgi:hypothetical protein
MPQSNKPACGGVPQGGNPFTSQPLELLAFIRPRRHPGVPGKSGQFPLSAVARGGLCCEFRT